MPPSRILAALLALPLLWFAGLTGPAAAHPLPISSIDVEYAQGGLEGQVIVHMRDLAPELGISSSANLPSVDSFLSNYDRIVQIFDKRLHFDDAAPRWTGMTASDSDPEALRLTFTIAGPLPPALTIQAVLFPQLSDHQTFINVYEDGELRQQWLLGADAGSVTYYSGSRQGLLAVARSFVPSGAYHILIGPDHVLFLIGLLLTGGTLRRLALIVTAFTLGHSITLALAALNLVALPPAIVEPAIALTIVIVGIDNLMRGKGRDIRALLALVFGLVHGFGFAYTLREVGLPQANLAVALFSFNLGVELGQLAIVGIVAPILALLARRGEGIARFVRVGGSLAVIAAGAYWFVERI